VPPGASWRTLTLEDAKEFAEREQLTVEATLKIHFARPYRAWQRSTNENANDLIQLFFPKGTDLADIPEDRFPKL
jgi:IS30 family transposase